MNKLRLEEAKRIYYLMSYGKNRISVFLLFPYRRMSMYGLCTECLSPVLIVPNEIATPYHSISVFTCGKCNEYISVQTIFRLKDDNYYKSTPRHVIFARTYDKFQEEIS